MSTVLIRAAGAAPGVFRCACLGLFSICLLSTLVGAQPVVPGMGIIIDEVGDDFEEERWEFMPQPSQEQPEHRQKRTWAVGNVAQQTLARGTASRNSRYPQARLHSARWALWQ